VDLQITSLKSGYVVDTQWIVDHQNSIKVVDSRTQAEFDGATDFGEARGGHYGGSRRKVQRPDLLIGAPVGVIGGVEREWNFSWKWDYGQEEVRSDIAPRELGAVSEEDVKTV